MNNSNQRKIGAVLSYVSIIINTLVGLLYTPFLISKLGQSEYGLYSLVASIIGTLTILDFGFGNAIVVYTTKYRENREFENEKKLHGMFLIVYFIIGIVATLIGLILFFSANNLFSSTMTQTELYKIRIMLLILTFNLAITFSFSIYSSIISAYEKFIFQKVLAILNTLLKPVLMMPLLFMGYKSITMCVVITIVNAIVLLSNYLYCKNKLKIKIKYTGFDKSVFKVVAQYSIWLFLGVIVDKINWSIDQFVLGAVSGTIAVSIYSIASQLNTLFVNLSTAISGVLLPKMSKMVANEVTSKQLTDEFIKVGRIQFYVIFLIASGFVLFGKEFILFWVGKEYINSYYCTLWLMIPTTIPLIQSLGISIRQAMNKHKFAALTNVFIALLNLVISIFLASLYGPVGSAAGTGIGILVSIIIINIYYNKVIKLDMCQFWRTIVVMFTKVAIPVVVIIVIMHILPLTGIKSVIIYGSIYTLIYLFVVYKFVLNTYEKEIVNSVKRKVINK